MIRIQFKHWLQKDRESRNLGSHRHSASRDDWKKFICYVNALHPDLIVKSKGGNGTHSDILGYHVSATSHWCVVFSRNDVADKTGYRCSFNMSYNQIETIDIDKANGLIIINDLLAIK